MKRPLLTIIGLTAFMTAVSAFLIDLDNSNKEWREQTQTESTIAKITSTDVSFHNTAYFEYTVAGKNYHSGMPGWGESVYPGDCVVLHYNPDNPAQVTLGNFGPMHPWALVWVFALVTFAVLLSYYLICIRPKLISLKAVSISNHDLNEKPMP